MNQDADIVELLAQHEEAIARLYQAFVDRIPSMQTFWKALVRDERAHAEVLRVLRIELETGRVKLGTRRFEPAAVHTAVGYVERQTVTILAADDPPTSLQALSMSLDLERSMLDKEFFSVFEPDSNQMRKEFQQLREHTQEHVRRVQKQLEAVRAAGAA